MGCTGDEVVKERRGGGGRSDPGMMGVVGTLNIWQ